MYSKQSLKLQHSKHSLTLATNARSGLLSWPGSLGLGGSLCGLCWSSSSFLHCLSSLGLLLCSPMMQIEKRLEWEYAMKYYNSDLLDGLISLGFANLRFLVPLGQDLSEGSTNDGTLELLGLPGLFLGLLFLLTLPVLTPVDIIKIDR